METLERNGGVEAEDIPVGANPFAEPPGTVDAPENTMVGRQERGRKAGSAALEAATRSVLRPSLVVQFGQAVRSSIVAIRRNMPLTAATVAVVAVAATLAGAALFVQTGVDAATVRWQGGVQSIVFLEPGLDQASIDAVGEELQQHPAVDRLEFFSQQDAAEEFAVMFRNSPDLLESVEPSALPASWRIWPVEGASTTDVDSIGVSMEGRAGVYSVVYARDAVESVLGLSELVQRGLFAGAGLCALAGVVLVFVTCRAAAWARRDELAVMRAVGAPRWLLRAPFVLEGAVAGLVGSLFAVVGLYGVAGRVHGVVDDGEALAILAHFSVAGTQLNNIALVLVAGSTLVGAAVAAVAARRWVTAPKQRRSR